MKKFNRNEWDKIVNDAFSPDAPEPVFSQRYQCLKKEILNQADFSAERNITMNQSKIGFAFTCTASLALAGLAVWGSVNIYQAGHNTLDVKTEQKIFSPAEAVEITETEPPEDDFKISVEQTGDIVNVSIPVEENDTLYEVKFGYVPNGLEYREDGPYALKYHNYEDENDEHAITPDSCRVVDPSEPYTNTYDTVYEVDKFKTSSGNSAIFLKKSRGWDMLFVQFEGTPYIESCFIKGFSYEEMHQFADEMYLEETDTEKAGLWKGAPNSQDIFDYEVIFQCEEDSDSMGNYELSFGWTPQDISFQTITYLNDTWNEFRNSRRSLSYILYRVEDVSQPFISYEPNITDTESTTTVDGEGNDVIWCNFGSDSLIDRKIYVHFKNSPYIAELWTVKLTDDECFNIIDNLSLTETEAQYYTIYPAN